MSTLANILIAGAGSCLGGMARYGITKLCTKPEAGTFPWGTLLVNLAGCLIIGILCGAIERGATLSAEMRLFLTVGVCGGFTTFSTFMNENYGLLASGHTALFFLYTAASLIGGLALVWCGYILTRS